METPPEAATAFHKPASITHNELLLHNQRYHGGKLFRIMLGIEYAGTQYQGWQRQAGCATTIQEILERALSFVAAAPVSTFCAGRTDAGVHALEQVVHFDTASLRSNDAWVLGTNRYLPSDIRVLWARPVDNQFHARFSAKARCYHYWLDNRKVASAIYRPLRTWHPWPLDAPRMHQAAQVLLGEQNFNAFRSSECQSPTPMRCVHSVNIERHGDLVKIEITANAFLHHMVRNIVGSLLPIGDGRKPLEWLAEVLRSQDRTQAGVTAPPQGLYLHSVIY